MVSLAALQMSVGPCRPRGQRDSANSNPGLGHTVTPIKHVIVIIGENRSFDHVFATYVPKKGETVDNLLSEGHHHARHQQERDPRTEFRQGPPGRRHRPGNGSDTFLLSPPQSNFPNDQLPAPLTGGPSGDNAYFSGTNPCGTTPAAVGDRLRP
jgi:phospholipase C